MTEYQFLRVSRDAGVARIAFNRPKHNVLNIEMINELNRELADIAGDTALKCAVFLAEGKSWCAGVEVGDHKPECADEMIRSFDRIFELIDMLDIPTIAAVHGACLGGGMEVAIACDMIIATESASFGQPEIKLGFLPPYAAIRLPQLIGPAKAIEICTTGKRYSAKDARRMGFVSQCVTDETFSEAVETLIGEIQASSPLIIRLNKRAVKEHLGMPFAKALLGVSDLFLNTLMKTEDTLEGLASFEQKRKPEWKNR